MSDLTLVIGDKTLSSWSLRPWLVLTHFDIAFREEKILLDRPDTKERIARHSPTGLVPCLLHEKLAVWDSLAISEYLHDLFPERGLWPRDRSARAVARSAAAEMHAGFQDLRLIWPMYFTTENLNVPINSRVKKAIDRIEALWTGCRENFGAVAQDEDAGPFLFGRFSIADAMYAPVVSRFRTYGPLNLNPAASAYADAVWALPAMQKWGEGARAEAP